MSVTESNNVYKTLLLSELEVGVVVEALEVRLVEAEESWAFTNNAKNRAKLAAVRAVLAKVRA